MLLKIGDRMKKLILKYILLLLPFLIGSIMFSFSIYNIISSLLFFVGGYVFLKNVFDYRKIKRNKKIIDEKYVFIPRENNYYKSCENIVGIKRTRVHHRVRKRVKNIDF